MPDKTKTIVFTMDQRYDTVPPVFFTAGQVVAMRGDLADRWLSRGVASDDPALIAKAQAGKEPTVEPESLPPEIPANWQSLKAEPMRELAGKLGATHLQVQNRQQAFEYVSAKVAEFRASQVSSPPAAPTSEPEAQ